MLCDVATGTETHNRGNTVWSGFTRGEQRSLDSLQLGAGGLPKRRTETRSEEEGHLHSGLK